MTRLGMEAGDIEQVPILVSMQHTPQGSRPWIYVNWDNQESSTEVLLRGNPGVHPCMQLDNITSLSKQSLSARRSVTWQSPV